MAAGRTSTRGVVTNTRRRVTWCKVRTRHLGRTERPKTRHQASTYKHARAYARLVARQADRTAARGPRTPLVVNPGSRPSFP